MTRRNRETRHEEEIPMALQTPEPESEAPPPRAVFVAEFVRLRHHGVLGEAFASQLRGEALVAKQPPKRLPLTEWDSMFQEWSRKSRG
jgi:hypothetical protein